jgi:Coenzyme PQQ synthesis protein D (PqqD)
MDSVAFDASYEISGPNVIYQAIEGEVVIIRLDTGTYYNLDTIGAEIWQQVARRATLAEIVDTLAAHYDGERASIQNAVVKLIGELESEKLISCLASEAGSGGEPTIAPNGDGEQGARSTFHAPVFEIYTDMQELMLLDPIHEVGDMGWPTTRSDPAN